MTKTCVEHGHQTLPTLPFNFDYTFYSGWWFTPSENISQLGLLFPIYRKKMFRTPNQCRTF
jgi:hypothetical protein